MERCRHARLTQMKNDEVRCLDCGWTAPAPLVRGAMQDSIEDIAYALDQLAEVTEELHASLKARYREAGSPSGDHPAGLRRWIEEGTSEDD